MRRRVTWGRLVAVSILFVVPAVAIGVLVGRLAVRADPWLIMAWSAVLVVAGGAVLLAGSRTGGGSLLGGLAIVLAVVASSTAVVSSSRRATDARSTLGQSPVRG